MGKRLYVKLEPVDRQGICVKCEIRPQASRSPGKYRAICHSCHRARHYEGQSYKSHKKLHCGICAFVAVHPCQLDVDHIDGNRTNNEPDNLQTLCANCHRLKTQLNGDANGHKKYQPKVSLFAMEGL